MAPETTGEGGGRAERLFLKLIRPEGPRGCEGSTADDLRAAAAIAFRHGLFLLVDRRIREHAESFAVRVVAGDYEPSTRTLRRRHISHALRYEREEHEALAVLDAAGVPSVILKGSAISRNLYGDPHYRTSADIDLLVRAGDVSAADAALTGAGYRRDNARPLSFWMGRLHHAVYQRPGSRIPVEIHWHFSIPGFFNLDSADIWAGVTLEGLRGRLEPTMSLTQLLMHHHLHGCVDLRTLVDLVWALEHHRGQLDERLICEHLGSTGLLVVSGIARLQAERLWGERRWYLDGHGRRHALRVRLLAKAAGLALRPGRRPRPGDRFLHAVIHRFGLDAPRRVIASVTKTLLPSRDDVRALTGSGRSGLAGYVRYFGWRLGGRAAGNEGKGRPQR